MCHDSLPHVFTLSQEIFLHQNKFRQLRHADPKLSEAGKPKHEKQFTYNNGNAEKLQN